MAQIDLLTNKIVQFLQFSSTIKGGIAKDANGHVYVALQGGKIGIIPASAPVPNLGGTVPGSTAQIPTPAGAAGPPSAVNMAVGADGNLWFTQTFPTDAGGNPIFSPQEKIGRMTPSGTITQFAVPTQFAGTPSVGISTGSYIMAGADGNVWFLEQTVHQIAKVTPSGVFTEFPLPAGASTVLGLAAGADGNIWVKEASKIYRVTPSGAIATFPTPTHNTGSDVELKLAPDGALWFLEDSKLGRITTTGMISEFSIPPDSGGATPFPFNLSFSPDGGGVFIEFSNGNGQQFSIPASTSKLLTAALPASRAPQVGGAATAFYTALNTGTTAATGCAPTLAGNVPASFAFQTTDPKTNALTGQANTPVNIAANGSQSFVVAFTPNAPFLSTDTAIGFSCANADAAPIVLGLNTLLLSASTTPVPDVVALAASGDPGIVDIPGASGTGVFAVATVNVGASGAITAPANTGSATLPVSISLCPTNPQTGACLAAPAASVMTTINAGATPTFGIFVTGSGTVPFDPANNRVFVQFSDTTNAVRGSTSVAVRTQ